MSRELEPGFAPEEVVNIETFSTDAEREKYFRFGLGPREETAIRRYFVGPSPRLLDIGCGYGRTSRPLAEMGFRVTAIDIVPRMIVEARAATSAVRFCLMSATDLGLADETFDYAFLSYNGIDFIIPEARRAQALREIWRVLRPGGRLIYSAHNWLAFMITNLRHPSRRQELVRNLAKAVVVGFPEVDQFDTIDPADVRRRWAFPPRSLSLPSSPTHSAPTRARRGPNGSIRRGIPC